MKLQNLPFPLKRIDTAIKTLSEKKEKTLFCNITKSSPIKWGFFINNKKKNQETMEKILLEIRDAEGGTDAKLLVKEMKDIYLKTAKINNIN